MDSHTSSTLLKFDALPVEVIQRIASVCTCQSVLALCATNRLLHHACFNRAVFEGVILNRQDSSSTVPVWEGCSVIEDYYGKDRSSEPITTSQLWVRFALADDKAARLLMYWSPIWRAHNVREISTWVPQLVAMKHPFVQHLRLPQLAHYLEGNICDIRSEHALAFCFAAHLLLQTTSPPAPPAVSSDQLLARCMLTLHVEILKRPLFAPGRGVGDVAAKRNTALVGVALMGTQLRRAVAGHRVRLSHAAATGLVGRPTPQRNPPCTEKIPFLDLMRGMPPPFSPEAADHIPTSHLAVMTDESFIEHGSWEGYYCYSFDRGGRPLFFDAPMRDIRLDVVERKVIWQVGVEVTTLHVRGQGVDGVGPFTLTGKIWTDTGKIELAKEYVQSLTVWTWGAFMTPFGIVGTWGEGEWGGWLWLWKSEWSSDST